MWTPSMDFDARVLRALLRRNLNAFVEKSFSTLAPGQAFRHGIYRPSGGSSNAFVEARSGV
jgi:hypothetical protein